MASMGAGTRPRQTRHRRPLAPRRLPSLLALEVPTTTTRPRVPRELPQLIRRMASEHPLWGAPRIHAELRMLGFEVSKRTVARCMPRRLSDPAARQQWRHFLRDHKDVIAAMDFLTVPTITLDVVYVFSSSTTPGETIGATWRSRRTRRWHRTSNMPGVPALLSVPSLESAVYITGITGGKPLSPPARHSPSRPRSSDPVRRHNDGRSPIDRQRPERLLRRVSFSRIQDPTSRPCRPKCAYAVLARRT